jgi:hypothetical protein
MSQKGGGKVRKATATLFFASVLLVISFAVPTAAGAGSITLTPTAQSSNALVSVAGTGFGASRNVIIAFGGEIKIVAQPFVPVTSPGYRGYNWTNRPIKPGSMHIHVLAISGPAQGYEEDIIDDGAGTLYRTNDMALWGILDYALGGFSRNSTNTPNEYEWNASYTMYEYNNVTSYGNVTTNASGMFSAGFTVPAVANGNYNVTVIDAGGNLATATLNVSSSIPELLPIGPALLLSAMAVVAGSWHFRKRPRSMR